MSAQPTAKLVNPARTIAPVPTGPAPAPLSAQPNATPSAAALPEVLNMRGLEAFLGYNTVYIRKLVVEGKIPARKELIPGTTTERWAINRADAIAYKLAHTAGANGGGTHTRSDGRNKYTAYMTPGELKAFEAWRAATIPTAPALVKTNAAQYKLRKARKAAKLAPAAK